MSSAPSNPNTDVLKLRIELERLKIEQARQENEKRRNYLDEWRTNLAPIDHALDATRKNGVTYAQAGIRNVFLLNGGALIAVPTFAQLLKTPLADSQLWFLSSVGCFVVGLVLITVVALLGYLSTERDIDSAAEIRLRTAEGIKQTYFPSKPPEQPETASRSQNATWANLYARIAVVLGCMACGFFLVGVVLAMLVLAGVRA